LVCTSVNGMCFALFMFVLYVLVCMCARVYDRVC